MIRRLLKTCGVRMFRVSGGFFPLTQSTKWLTFAALIMTTCFTTNAFATKLTDLGYPNGLSLNGPGATQTVYFPLPVNTSGATLLLHADMSAALDRHSSITVLVGGVPLATVLDTGTVSSIAIPPQFTKGEFLAISFTADQTIDDSDQCYANDSAANWSVIAPDTTLTPVSNATQGIGAVWRGLGTPLTIVLPAAPSLADVQTALILGSSLVERGIAPFYTTAPADGDIKIDPQASLTVVQAADSAYKITVPNPAAARGLVAGGQAMRSDQTSTAFGSWVPNPVSSGDSITMGSLGLASVTLPVAQDAKLDLSLPLASLPAGQHASAITLFGNGASLPPGETEIISLELGGNVLWSEAFTGAVALNGVKVDLPDRLLAAGAGVTLNVARLSNNTGCFRFAPLPFTLQNDTALTLAAGNPNPERFAAFTAAGNTPVPVLVDVPPATLTPALPLISELLGAAAVNPLAVTVSGTQTAPTAPFILISRSAGKTLLAAPIPDPSAGLVVPLPNQNATITLPASNLDSLLQLVQSGSTAHPVTGLWLRPGAAASLTQAALPGDGNVALYDGSSTPATFLTILHAAQLTPVASGVLGVVLDNWVNELFAAIWLLLTVTVVIIFVRRRRQGK